MDMRYVSPALFYLLFGLVSCLLPACTLLNWQLFAQGFINLFGNDISQKLLDIAQKKNIYKKLVCSDAGNVTQLPFEESK